MAKKQNKKDKKDIVEQNEVDAVEENVSETESVSSESDAAAVDASPDEVAEPDSVALNDEVEDIPSEDEELSPDDLLEDVRRSLIEENEMAEKEKKPSWWQRLGGGTRKAKDTNETTDVVDVPKQEIVLAAEEDVEVVEGPQEEDAGESIDDLIEILEAEEEKAPSKIELAPVQVQHEKPEPVKVDVAELKKRAFTGSTPEDEDNFSDVRAVALEGGEEVFVEVEIKTEDPVEDRIKSFENALRPYRRYLNWVFAFIGLIVIIATSALLYDAYRQSLPPEPTKVVSNLPYPAILNLPGGLSFNLGRGSLDDGKWNPRGPEWLEGTEVCRWVAIPYSRQLEAVIRTLTREDQLKLVMSNSDVVEYDVFSITQMSIEDMQKGSGSTPCLLLVLADTETDTRWVVTSYP